MNPCISVENMRLSDAYTIANFVPSLELMYRAAMCVYVANHWQGRTAIVVGSGNNGGDGFALAWILKEKGFDNVVDCLLGTGFSGTVRGNYRDAIESINESGAYVISVDINSGMNGDTGVAELAVRSALTVTIGFVKTGLVAENAGNYIKRLVCADIGIVLLQEEGIITEETCPPWLDMEIIRLF